MYSLRNTYIIKSHFSVPYYPISKPPPYPKKINNSFILNEKRDWRERLICYFIIMFISRNEN